MTAAAPVGDCAHVWQRDRGCPMGRYRCASCNAIGRRRLGGRHTRQGNVASFHCQCGRCATRRVWVGTEEQWRCSACP